MSELNINGMTTIDDVLVCIKEAVESGDQALAIDQIEQLREYVIENDIGEVEIPLSQEDIDQCTKYGDYEERFGDARDHHLINQNFNRAFGVKK